MQKNIYLCPTACDKLIHIEIALYIVTYDDILEKWGIYVGCASGFCGVSDVVSMMTARVITTIHACLGLRSRSIVVMTLAVIMPSAKI